MVVCVWVGVGGGVCVCVCGSIIIQFYASVIVNNSHPTFFSSAGGVIRVLVWGTAGTRVC